MRTPIELAVESGDLDELKWLLEAGADPNLASEGGENLLTLATSAWETNQDPEETVRLLLEASADPDGVHDDVCPLVSAIFNSRPKVVELLLRYGANPDTIVDGDELIYDLAEFDYRYEQYNLRLPEEPTDDDKKDEDAWIKMLYRLAVKYAKRPPSELRILRSFGAKTAREPGSSAQGGVTSGGD